MHEFENCVSNGALKIRKASLQTKQEFVQDLLLKKWVLGGNEHWWIAGDGQWNIANSCKSMSLMSCLME